jgi:hypothetical protein
MKATRPKAPPKRLPAEAELEELPPRHNPVLTPSELRYGHLHRSSSRFDTHSVFKCELDLESPPYGPGVRSTIASAATASASRVAAPCRELERARR